MFKQNQVSRLPNLRDASLLPTPVAGVSMGAQARLPIKATFTLSALEADILAANDYGSVKICDLPANNIMILQVVVNLTTTQSGMTSNLGTALSAAIGTAATASTDFSGTNEKNLVQAITGTGGSGVGALAGSSFENGGLGPIRLAAGAKSVYLNVADPVTSGTGIVLASGTIDIYYLDLTKAGA